MYMYMYIYTRMCIHMCVYIYIYMYTHTYVCIYIYTYAYTHKGVAASGNFTKRGMQGGPETSNRLNRIREYKRKQLNEYYIYIYVYLSNNNNKNNASNSNSSSSRNSNSHLFGGGCLGELHEARDVGQQRVQEGDDEGLQRGSQSINDVVDVSKTYKITIKRKRQK